MKRWFALCFCLWLVFGVTLSSEAQLIKRGLKTLQPNGLGEAGGEFMIERVDANLTLVPYAASFSATARLQVSGLRGAVKKMQIILQGERRVTKVTSGGKPLVFTHIGSFLVIELANQPLLKDETRTFDISYTGKVYSVSQRLVREYRIEKYTLKYSVIPRSGSMEGVASINLLAIKDPFMTPAMENMYLPPLDDDQPTLIVSLNNKYAVADIRLNNRPTTFYHAAGGVHVALPKKMKPNDRNALQIAYNGKVHHIDKNLLWDAFEPIYSIYRYYPLGPVNLGAY